MAFITLDIKKLQSNFDYLNMLFKKNMMSDWMGSLWDDYIYRAINMLVSLMWFMVTLWAVFKMPKNDDMQKEYNNRMK